MEQTLTDTLGNTIVFKYDETTDSVSVKNSAVSSEFMEVIKNIDSLVVEFDVIMIPEFLEYDTWSDDESRGKLKLFWDEHKVSK
jgi:hypothetical protein